MRPCLGIRHHVAVTPINMASEGCGFLVQTTCQDRSYGARPLRRAIQRHIEDTLSDALIAGDMERGAIEVYLDGERGAFRLSVETSSSPSPS